MKKVPAKSDIKLGFYVGIGVALALLVVGVLQMLTLRAVNRNG